ncbi:MAG TPA: alpha-amylase/4-alpha-glucanotransferase domain-containing protein [Chloroflexia bacterium]|nr:alpha-amylase/4-alpha-glucanotransferase domain-containing protein [Chloroflexia bacterium]
MSAQGNGNGHGASGEGPGGHFAEDAGGTTIDSGAAVCRFDRLRGGRLERWQWRTVPPGLSAQPGGRHATPTTLDLVDPQLGALIDHFMPLGTRPEEVVSGSYQEYGDFVEGEFRSQAVDTGGELRIGMLKDGSIRAGKRVAEVRLAKSSALRPGAPDIASLYRVINSSLRPMQILFALEFNLYAPGIYSQAAMSDGFYLVDGERPPDGPELGSLGVSPDCTSVTLANAAGEMAVQLGWDRECDLWRMPSPGTGPGVRLFAVWRIQLPPRDNWAMGLWLAPG